MKPAQIKAAITRNQARAIDLLQWSKDIYAQFIYDMGMRFLNAYVGDDAEAIKMLEERIEFWNWWKLIWNVREEAFILEWDGLEDSIEIKDLQSMYRDLHNPEVLACEIHPPKEVYGENFTLIQMASS